MLRGIIFALLLVTTFTFVSCGGGGSSSDIILPTSDGDTGEYISITEELSGTISVNSETGVSIYESEEKEINPGLLFKRSTVLTAKDPHNDQLGYSGMSILKFTNTTGNEQTTKFIENIPKSFATHVDQLEYKVLINKSSNLTITDLLDDSSSFVGIDDLVNKGYVEVLEEDPLLAILIGGAASIGSFYVIFENPDIAGLTPHSTADKVEYLSDDEKKKWMEDRLLTKYCSAVRHSAEANNIPAQLLANIILNEMADYQWEDTLQEIGYTGENRSHGWPQLQPKRIIDHGLIDIGSVDEVRDPTVDIVEDDLTYESIGSDGIPIMVTIPVNEIIWNRLIRPESSIELAAREIAYLLDMFKKGSSVLNNPWAKALLKNPEEGIDRNNIYANLKILPTSDDPDELQIALDRTLAVLVAAGYNGSGAIFYKEKENEVFTDMELSWIEASGYDGLIQNKIPWEFASDLRDTIPGTETLKYSFLSPRIHGSNAGWLFPKGLHEFECLEETVLWPNYPNAEYCSMKEDERTERYTIYIDIDSATSIHCLYYPTGQLEWEQPNVDNKVDGIWKLYNDDGSLRAYILYADGEQI